MSLMNRSSGPEALAVQMLGVRGSVPVTGSDFQAFGTGTSCVRVLAGEQEIYLDGGSGMVLADPKPDTRITILLSHVHLDHILGLPMFSGMVEEGRKIRIGMRRREGVGVREALDGVFKRPYWPLGIFDLPADEEDFDIDGPFSIGTGDDAVAVDEMEGNHPGGCSVFRLTYRGNSLVYATDFEHTGEDCERLIDFSRNADLLIYDGQYKDSEYERFRGFGHSTAGQGIGIAKKAGVKRLVITHHAPTHRDRVLSGMEAAARRKDDSIRFAREGDIFKIGEIN